MKIHKKKWYLQMNDSIEKVCSQLNLVKEEKDSLQKVEQQLYKMLESFQKYGSYPIDLIKITIQTIFDKDQVEQRSEQWYEDMQHILTASEFSKLFDSPRTRGTLVLSKTQAQEKRANPHAKPTEFLNPMDWGVRFEPVVREYLEDMWKCKIYESGRLKHQTNPRLGASPDGIIIEVEDIERYGRLVEIKCPYSREVGKKVPFEYWCQMQIQMEVTNLNECEYVEVEILSKNPKNINTENSVLFNTENSIKQLYLLQNNNQSYVYSYSNEGKDNLLKHGYILIETIDYVIKKLHNVLIKRDSKWYESTKKIQEEFWEDVEKAKKGLFVLPESKRKRNNECMISDE